MAVFRRVFSRLLRLRNLITLTVLVILLYLLRSLRNTEPLEVISSRLQAQSWTQESNFFVPKSLKKIDWHNYTQIDLERRRRGLGEQGIPAHLPEDQAELEKRLYAVNGFNGALSDRIPLNRSLPDIRHQGCREKLYIESLPTVSVVVPFHNEHWSTLLRTAFSVLYRSPPHLIKEIFLVDDASTKAFYVMRQRRKKLYIESLPTVSVVVPFHNQHWSTLLRTAFSVLNRSPPHLIKEIFLVDDASTKDFLKKDLEEYLAKNMPKVKVIRLEKRSGLITARLAGADKATADVLIFLDSHTEANVNWLPPLLEPIALNHRTVVCPFIDVIAYDTFEYRAQDEGARGAFDWEFFYKRLPVLPKDLENMPEPFESPVMAGGLFAISRAFFQELGGYDPGLDIWGGEQYELSFKIWQCGGRMLDAPCSRVGHIYRKFAPFPNPNHGDFVGKNYRRVAEVWMDEYAQYLYKRRPHYLNIPPGDLTERKALREKLKCKPFRWFMTQVAFDLTYKYPPIEPSPFAEGRITPLYNGKLCVDAHHGGQMEPIRLSACDDPNADTEFTLSWHKDIRLKNRNMCWDLPDSAPKSPIILYSCHLSGGNQLWKYDLPTKQLRHGAADFRCLDYNSTSRAVYIERCDDASRTQQWKLGAVHHDVMRRWDEPRERPVAPVERYP